MNQQVDVFPLITVVTASYKKFTHVFETINSVIKQSYPRIEYIICDDGSDNFPEAEIRNYITSSGNKLENFIIIRQPHNIGTVRNLNSAYKKGNGNYFINLSCGDIFFERDTVKKIVNVFISSEADVVVTSRILYKNSFDPICLLPHISEREIINSYDSPLKQYKALILGQFFDMASGSAMSYSRDVIKQFGYFDENYVLWEDGPFLIKYLWDHQVECAHNIISIWYEDDGMSRGTIHPKLISDSFKYNQTERCKHKECLTKKEIRRLDYLIKYFDLSHGSNFTVFKKASFYLQHFSEYVFYKKHLQKRIKRIKEDREMIDKLDYKLYFLGEKNK